MVLKLKSDIPDKNDSNDFAKLIEPTKSNKEEWSENPTGDDDIYMNEQFTPNIPVDRSSAELLVIVYLVLHISNK